MVFEFRFFKIIDNLTKSGFGTNVTREIALAEKNHENTCKLAGM